MASKAREVIYAIDPGPVQSAWCEFNGDTICAGISPNEELIAELRQDRKDILAIEMIASYGMPVGAEVFNTCVFIGRLIEASGVDPMLVFRKDVKIHLCYSLKASDSNIRQALIDRFGAPGTKGNKGLTYGIAKDMWSALAVATYAFDKLQEVDKDEM